MKLNLTLTLIIVSHCMAHTSEIKIGRLGGRVSVCVCVRERERERERGGGGGQREIQTVRHTEAKRDREKKNFN